MSLRSAWATKGDSGSKTNKQKIHVEAAGVGMDRCSQEDSREGSRSYNGDAINHIPVLEGCKYN